MAIPFGIPTYWSPEAALAIFEFVDEMRDIILGVYGTHILDAARQRGQSALTERVVIPDDELPSAGTPLLSSSLSGARAII